MSTDNNNVESLLKKLVKHQKQMNSLLDDVLTSLGGGASSSDNEKKQKKPRKPNAWSSWVQSVSASHTGDFAKFRESHPDMKGHAIQFAKEWKETHITEYEAFVAEHTVKYAAAAATPDASASEASESEAAVKPKVKRVAKKVVAATAPTAPTASVVAPTAPTAPTAEKPKAAIKRVIKKASPASDVE